MLKNDSVLISILTHSVMIWAALPFPLNTVSSWVQLTDGMLINCCICWCNLLIIQCCLFCETLPCSQSSRYSSFTIWTISKSGVCICSKGISLCLITCTEGCVFSSLPRGWNFTALNTVTVFWLGPLCDLIKLRWIWSDSQLLWFKHRNVWSSSLWSGALAEWQYISFILFSGPLSVNVLLAHFLFYFFIIKKTLVQASSIQSCSITAPLDTRGGQSYKLQNVFSVKLRHLMEVLPAAIKLLLVWFRGQLSFFFFYI